MRKTFLAVALSAAMVVTAVPFTPAAADTTAASGSAVSGGAVTGGAVTGGAVTPEPTKAPEGIAGADAEELTSSAWWTGVTSKFYSLKDGKVTFNVDSDETSAAFTVELVGKVADGSLGYLTTNTDGNAWTAEGSKDKGETFEGVSTDKVMAAGHSYKVTVSRSGADFTIAYVDATDNTEFATIKCNGTNFGDDVAVHFIAQVGTFKVSADTEVREAPVADATQETPAPTKTPAADNDGAKPATNFEGITTQPVVKYTFDKADEVKLAGEAEVKDGILNLAKTATNNVTYAQIADLTGYDFSKGVTLTADVKVDGYTSDWTPIFMLGDGTIGGEGADATALYHFSQGFSSVGGANGSFFDGYFGSAISAPYTWDYFNNEANRGKWYTIAVTITPTEMTTYINGQAVQAANGDYANVLQAFKVAKNNYLGSSYWAADPDFVGSLDNVGIYNTALSAEDMGKLTTGKKADVKPVEPAEPTNKYINITDVEKSIKVGSKKVTGTISYESAKVTVKVNKKSYKATIANGKFTAKVPALKNGDKVVITASASGYYTYTEDFNVGKKLTVKKVTAKKNTKKITGTVSVKKATVKVKVGKKAYKKATVKGTKFTFKVSKKLKKGTKVVVKATKKTYNTATKTVKVK